MIVLRLDHWQCVLAAGAYTEHLAAVVGCLCLDTLYCSNAETRYMYITLGRSGCLTVYSICAASVYVHGHHNYLSGLSEIAVLNLSQDSKTNKNLPIRRTAGVICQHGYCATEIKTLNIEDTPGHMCPICKALSL